MNAPNYRPSMPDAAHKIKKPVCISIRGSTLCSATTLKLRVDFKYFLPCRDFKDGVFGPEGMTKDLK